MPKLDKVNIDAAGVARRRTLLTDGSGGLAWQLPVEAWQEPVIDRHLTAPPVTPSVGDRYIVGSPATGDWEGLEYYIVEYSYGGWECTIPDHGWQSYIIDEHLIYGFHDAAGWGVLVTPKTVDLPFRGSTGPFVESSSQTYEVLYRWDFAGSARMGIPAAIGAIAWRESGANHVDLRVYDLDNSLVVCELTGLTTGTIGRVDLGALANVPEDPAIWEFQMEVGVGTKGRASSIQIRW